jgi:hypothetical protein
MTTRKISDDQIRAMKEDVFVHGMSKAEAGRQYGIGKSTVTRYLQLALPTTNGRSISDAGITKLKTLVQQGESPLDVANSAGVSVSTLNRYMKLDLSHVASSLPADDDDYNENAKADHNGVQVMVTKSSVVVGFVDSVETIESTNPLFDELVKLATSGEIYTIPVDELVAKVNVSKAINRYSDGHIVCEYGVLKYKDKEIDSTLARYILHNMENGNPITNIVKFMNNLYENPSYRAVNEVFDFIKAANLPISDDGYLIAYKKVRNNYTDCHSGTFNNAIGAKPSMPRNEVNEDKNQTCSNGLHFCSASYLSKFGTYSSKEGADRIVIVKVNPKDIVSVPSDYNNAKARACDYEVIGEVKDASELEPFYYKGA